MRLIGNSSNTIIVYYIILDACYTICNMCDHFMNYIYIIIIMEVKLIILCAYVCVCMCMCVCMCVFVCIHELLNAYKILI